MVTLIFCRRNPNMVSLPYKELYHAIMQLFVSLRTSIQRAGKLYTDHPTRHDAERYTRVRKMDFDYINYETGEKGRSCAENLYEKDNDFKCVLNIFCVWNRVSFQLRVMFGIVLSKNDGGW